MVRCKAFTHGFGAAGLVQAVDGFFASFIDTWTAELDSKPSATTSRRLDSGSDLELADLDYSAEDWAEIQMSLQLLGSARMVSDRLNTFETKLRSFLAQIASHFRLSQSDPQSFTIAATKGETQLLEQSTLNSADLYALFSAVEQEVQGMNTPMTAPLTTPHTSTFRQGSNPTSHPVAPESMLVQTRKSLSSFAQRCQTSTQRTILSPLRNILLTYPYLSIWASKDDPQRSSDLQIPTFSLSPTDSVQRVAEGLLNLPRLFEVYADDDALAFSLRTLPYVDPELLKSAMEQQHPEATSGQATHGRKTSIAAFAKPTPIDPEVVSSAWLASLGHTFVNHLTEKVLPGIAALSTPGAAQLSSDLEYLSNIVRALNVENEALERWRVAVNSEPEELRKEAREAMADGKDLVALRVAKMRGWM